MLEIFSQSKEDFISAVKKWGEKNNLEFKDITFDESSNADRISFTTLKEKTPTEAEKLTEEEKEKREIEIERAEDKEKVKLENDLEKLKDKIEVTISNIEEKFIETEQRYLNEIKDKDDYKRFIL